MPDDRRQAIDAINASGWLAHGAPSGV